MTETSNQSTPPAIGDPAALSLDAESPGGLDTVEPKPSCHICGREGTSLVRWPEGEGEMRYCFDCDFVFAWPVLDGNPVQTYTRAYLGLEGRARMDEFAVRFRRRRIVTAKESLGIWSPAHRDTFRWLQTHVPRGSTLLEIGCGLGAVMRSLKQQGYRPAGVDVAKPVVDSLSK